MVDIQDEGGNLITPSEALNDYREIYNLKDMRIKPNNTDEIIQMTAQNGMIDLPNSILDEDSIKLCTTIPKDKASASESRYLWVIRENCAPVAIENCEWGKGLKSEIIKHSNLTGGKPAYSGGELWFIARDKIAVNGNSGRYGPESEEELDAIVNALRRSGYHVASMGFDIDNPSVPNSVFPGNPTWQNPI
ncbi:hypothetical protein [Niveispirillum sp.]|uniref:hypothetical protein n=1 Tax=Niveispirillum sp. TaxID=1917217 RepID=UPI001B3D6D48|nr:hypothetical protein [Niveispirillum sp.]MBP7337757.1 hypothetical protein [Niveispirillum sp.]